MIDDERVSPAPLLSEPQRPVPCVALPPKANGTQIDFYELPREAAVAADDLPVNFSPRSSVQIRRQMATRQSDRNREPESAMLKGLLNSAAMEDRLSSAADRSEAPVAARR